jgi:hypothetical protein
MLLLLPSVLMAAVGGAILAGPGRATPPALDGGERTHQALSRTGARVV